MKYWIVIFFTIFFLSQCSGEDNKKKNNDTSKLIALAALVSESSKSNECPTSLRGCCYSACVTYDTSGGTIACYYGYALDSSWSDETACSDCDFKAKTSGRKTKKTNTSCTDIGFSSSMQQSFRYNGYASSSYACGTSSGLNNCTTKIQSFFNE